MPAKDNRMTSGKLIDAMEDLIPRVLGHETDERVQTDDRLLIEMAENRCRKGIRIWMPSQQRMNVWVCFKQRTGRHRHLLVRLWE